MIGVLIGYFVGTCVTVFMFSKRLLVVAAAYRFVYRIERFRSNECPANEDWTEKAYCELMSSLEHAGLVKKS